MHERCVTLFETYASVGEQLPVHVHKVMKHVGMLAEAMGAPALLRSAIEQAYVADQVRRSEDGDSHSIYFNTKDPEIFTSILLRVLRRIAETDMEVWMEEQPYHGSWLADLLFQVSRNDADDEGNRLGKMCDALRNGNHSRVDEYCANGFRNGSTWLCLNEEGFLLSPYSGFERLAVDGKIASTPIQLCNVLLQADERVLAEILAQPYLFVDRLDRAHITNKQKLDEVLFKVATEVTPVGSLAAQVLRNLQVNDYNLHWQTPKSFSDHRYSHQHSWAKALDHRKLQLQTLMPKATTLTEKLEKSATWDDDKKRAYYTKLGQLAKAMLGVWNSYFQREQTVQERYSEEAEEQDAYKAKQDAFENRLKDLTTKRAVRKPKAAFDDDAVVNSGEVEENSVLTLGVPTTLLNTTTANITVSGATVGWVQVTAGTGAR